MPFPDLIITLQTIVTQSEATIVAISCAIVAVILWLLGREPHDKSKPIILVDGSNVMFWHDNKADLLTLKAVIGKLSDQGFDPGVIFDANVGYKLEGRFRGHLPMARKLGLKPDQVVVVAKGEPADRLLLSVARDLNAKILSNDRFRDWYDAYPEAAEPGRLIRGGYSDGQVWFDPL